MDGNDLYGITEKAAGVGKHTSVVSLAKRKKHAYLSSGTSLCMEVDQSRWPGEILK